MTPPDGLLGEDAPEDRRRAADYAYDRGVHDAEVAANFVRIDSHLKVVNGSISDTARELRELNVQVADLKQAQGKRDAVSEALAYAVNRQTDSRISSRQFGVAITSVLLTAIAMFVTVVHPFA